MKLEELSERDKELLRLLSKGLSIRDVAREMHLTTKSVEARKHRLMSQYGKSQ